MPGRPQSIHHLFLHTLMSADLDSYCNITMYVLTTKCTCAACTYFLGSRHLQETFLCPTETCQSHQFNLNSNILLIGWTVLLHIHAKAYKPKKLWITGHFVIKLC